ncbi:hypothetical protein ACKKBG_A30095 [Auxenochlorella protothecoides x Auxenochlorella symbiontica]
MNPLLQQLDSGQRAQLDAYLDILMEWNQNMNLTGPCTREEALQRHVVDSLALLPIIEAHAPPCPPSSGPLTLMDVGSGAGFPGLVLAIARPAWRVTLLDSLAKRTRFLGAAAEAAGAAGVRVVCANAEAAGRDPALRDAFQVVTARAVAEMRVLAELCLPFLAPGGVWVAAKGPAPEGEVAAAGPALELLGAQLIGVEDVVCAGQQGRRTALTVRKLGPTPTGYPRAVGRPAKRPLGGYIKKPKAG